MYPLRHEYARKVKACKIQREALLQPNKSGSQLFAIERKVPQAQIQGGRNPQPGLNVLMCI